MRTDNTESPSIVISGLTRKQREILGAIRSYEAQIARAEHDLAHINAAMKIIEGSDGNKRTYIEMFNNPKRKHARNGVLSPAEFERQRKI